MKKGEQNVLHALTDESNANEMIRNENFYWFELIRTGTLHHFVKVHGAPNLGVARVLHEHFLHLRVVAVGDEHTGGCTQHNKTKSTNNQ